MEADLDVVSVVIVLVVNECDDDETDDEDTVAFFASADDPKDIAVEVVLVVNLFSGFILVKTCVLSAQ